MKEIVIQDEFFKLGQLLKFTGEADSGVHAKILIQDRLVKVNGKVEDRRGRKLYEGDQIQVENGQVYKLITEKPHS